MLRVIAGMDSPDPHPDSHIRFFGEDVANRSVGSRKVGFVFQHYALFKHMSVFENIAFGLRVRPRSQRPTEAAIRDKVGSLLKLIQLEGFGTRFPNQLSGGQRQRGGWHELLRLNRKSFSWMNPSVLSMPRCERIARLVARPS